MRSTWTSALRFASLSALLWLTVTAGGAQSASPFAPFAQPRVIPTGNWPAAVYTADVNGDGFPDLIYIDGGATRQVSITHVLLNDGKGNFKESAILATAGDSLGFGNLMGSGHIDIGWVTVDSTSTSGPYNYDIHVAANLGNGTFATPQNTVIYAAFGAQIEYVTAAKIYASGPDALIFEDVTNSNAFTPQVTNGRLTQSNTLALDQGPGPITVADLNGDGQNDLLIDGLRGFVNSVPKAQIFLNAAGSGFVANASNVFAGSAGVRSLLVADVNHDGRPDLIAEGANGRIDVFPGNGDGTFAAQSIGGTGTLDGLSGNGGHLIALADLNHDGVPDALTATPAGISALLGSGTAYLGLKGIYNAGPGRTSFATADFNGDGNLDLAVDSPEGIAILFGNADGSFQTSQAFAAGRPALASTLGGFTGSGYRDAAVATAATQAQLLLNQGDGTFVAAPGPTSTQTGPVNLWSTVAAGDFNADGKLDLLLSADGANSALPTTGSGLAVQFGHGDGSFEPPIPIPVANQFSQPNPASCQPPFAQFPAQLYGTSVVADFNGDGIPDIANRDSGAYRLLRGNPEYPNTSYSTIPTLLFAGADGTINSSDCNLNAHQLVAAGDLDGDGVPDTVFQSNGSLLVGLVKASAPTTIGDLAVDGSLTTPGQLTAPDLSPVFGGMSQALGYPAAIGSMVIADLDGDGIQDLLVLYHNLSADPANPGAQSSATRNWLYVWYGSGGGRFLTSAAHPQNPVRIQPSRDFYQIAVGRFDANNPRPLIAMSDGFLVSLGTLSAEAHFLAGQGINSLSAGDLRNLGTGVQDLVVANGGLTLSNPVTNHETLTANPDVNTGGITVLLNQSKASAAPIGMVTASPEPSYVGEPFTLTATVNQSQGNISFSIDGNGVGSAPVNASGVATTAGPSTLALGTHTLGAGYTGSMNNPAVGFSGSHSVVLSPTTTTLTPTTALTVYYGQPIDGTFAVQVLDANHPANGTYSVEDNGIDVAPCIGLTVKAPCPYGNPILVDAGMHVLTVHYLGDSYNAPSLSAPVSFTVLPDLTTTRVTSSVNPANLGQGVLFSVQVTGNYAVPNGTIELYDGASPLASNTLDSNGRAGNTVATLSLGTHQITVSYPGTKNFNPAVSPPLAERIVLVQPALASSTGLTSSLNPAAPGQPVTFTASVAVLDPLHPVAAGTVTFTIDGVAGAPVPLDSFANATFTSSTLATGSHTVSAAYSGSPGSAANPILPRATAADPQPVLPSVTPSLIEIITRGIAALPQGFTLTVSPTPVTIGAGRTAILLVSVQEFSGYSQPVALGCAGLPTEVACSFVQPVIPAGGGATTLALATSAPHDCGDPGHPYFLGSNAPPSGTIPVVAGALALLFFGRRRRRVRGAAWLVLLCAGLYTLSGCGRCTDLGTRPGTYTFMVTATPQGGSTAGQTQAIPLTVTIP